jgi:hypothetical protein
LLDNGNHHTHFTGFMLEEEIIASLWGSTSLATARHFLWHEHFCFMLTRNFGEEGNFKGEG